MVRRNNIPCNVFKKFPISCWKKVGNEAKITYRKENDVGCHILELDSLTTGANSVTLPRTNETHLKLFGRYVYYLLRPFENKGFLLHLDVHGSDGLDVRITVSNVFTELKHTNLSLHLPFNNQSKTISDEKILASEWTVLRLDLDSLLSIYHRRKPRWISRLQLSSSVHIVGILVSDANYSISEGKKNGTARKKSRKPLRFPLFRETVFESNGYLSPVNQPVEVRFPEDLAFNMKGKSEDSGSSSLESGNVDRSTQFNGTDGQLVVKDLPSNGTRSCEETTTYFPDLPTVNVTSENMNSVKKKLSRTTGNSGDCVEDINSDAESKIIAQEDLNSLDNRSSKSNEKCPNLWCSQILACPTYCSESLLSFDGRAVVFACETLVIVMDLETRKQHKLFGHLNEITAICTDSMGKLLASGCTTNGTDTDQPSLVTVHLWRMPHLDSARFSHQFIATGRALGVRQINGLSFSQNVQCLYGICEDEKGRGLVLVWDLRLIKMDSVVPVIARATTEPNMTCILPIPTETTVQNQRMGFVLRFVTVYSKQRSFRPNMENKNQQRNNTQSGFRIWRLKYDETISEGIEAKTRTHLSSAPVHFSSILSMKDCYELDFVDCCLVPLLPERKVPNVSSEMEQRGSNETYLLTVCSTSGHVVEFNPDLFAVTRVYRFTVKNRKEHTASSDIKVNIIYNSLKHVSTTKESDDSVGLSVNRIHYIKLGPGTLDGWLATGSEDGYFRLWNICDPTKQMVLEVLYPGPVCAVGSATTRPLPVDSRHGASELRWLSRAQIVLATKTGGLTCLNLTAEPGMVPQGAEDKGSFIAGPKLVDCEPSKLLAWQTDEPIIGSDVVMLGGDRRTSVVLTATEAGSIRVWKMTSVKDVATATNADQRGDEPQLPWCSQTVNTPMFDLSSPCEKLSHVVLIPTGAIEHDLQIACGYRDSGMIRMFCPSKNKLLQEITHHQGNSISVLKYSSCGTLLYSADTCGKLAVWRIHSDDKRQSTAELLRSRSEQIALFPAAELGTRSNTRLGGVLSCCVSDTRIAYIGPSQRMLIIADGPTLQNLVQIDLDQLARQCFPHRPDPLFGTLGLVNHIRPPMLDFSARHTQFDYPNLILAAPGGCVFRLHGADGRLLAYATSDTSEITERHGRLESDGNEQLEPRNRIRWSAMAISPDGRFMVLADAVRPLLYTASVGLHSYTSQHQNSTLSRPANRIRYKTFTGHLYPVTSILFTRDQKFCLTVDKASGLMGGSGIFVWYFSQPYRSIQISSKFSIGATNPLALEHDSGNGVSTVPFSSETCSRENSFKSEQGAIPKTPPPSATVDAFAARNDYVNDESLTNDLSSGAVCTDENDVRTTPQSYRHPKWSINRLSVRNIRFSEAIDKEESLLIFSKFHGCGGTTVRGVIGYCTDGLTVDSMVWDAESGLFVFTAGTFLICENLETGFQQVFASEAPHQIGPSGLGKVPNLCSELLTTLALSYDRRQLAVGTLTTWEVDDQSDIPVPNNLYTESRSAIIILTLKTPKFKYRIYPENKDRTEQGFFEDGILKRLQYSKVLREQHRAEDVLNQNATLFRITFTRNSRYMLTIGDYRTCVVAVWCTRTWTILKHCSIRGSINQISCSFHLPENFVTVGTVQSCLSRTGSNRFEVGAAPLVFWKLKELTRGIILTPKSGTTASQTDQEISSALYMKLDEPIHPHSSTTYSTGSYLRELLAVSDVHGFLFMWNPELCVCLFSWKPSWSEHGLLTSCGPGCLLTGDASGSLRIWHLHGDSLRLPSHQPAQGTLPRHYGDAAEFTDLATGIQVRQVHEIRSIQRSVRTAVVVGHFDADGQMGVVGTNDSNLWYVDWSNVDSFVANDITDDAGDDIVPGVVRMFAGHTGEICCMAWWNPQSFLSRDSSTTSADQCTALLLTATSNGSIRAWDVSSRELLCQLRVEDHTGVVNMNRKTAVCMATLGKFPVQCRGMQSDEYFRDELHFSNFTAIGCLAIAYSDTSMHLYCLHQLRLVAQVGSVSPVANDVATALKFVGQDHLVLGTKMGLIILLQVQTAGHVSVIRVLREHAESPSETSGIDELLCHSWPVADLSVVRTDTNCESGRSQQKQPNRFSGRAVSTYRESWQMQNNRSHVSEGMKDEVAANWIWLSVGRDARLGIWLLRAQYPTNSNTAEFVQSNPNSVRCQLLKWIALDATGWSEKPLETPRLPEPEDKMVNQCRYHVQFIPVGNVKSCVNGSPVSVERIKIAVCEASPSGRTTRFMIHAMDSAPMDTTQTKSWFEIPHSIHAFHFEATVPEVPGVPLRMLALGRVGTNYELISAGVYLTGRSSPHIQRMVSHQLKHLVGRTQDRKFPLVSPYSCHPVEDSMHLKTLIAVAMGSAIIVVEF